MGKSAADGAIVSVTEAKQDKVIQLEGEKNVKNILYWWRGVVTSKNKNTVQ